MYCVGSSKFYVVDVVINLLKLIFSSTNNIGELERNKQSTQQ